MISPRVDIRPRVALAALNEALRSLEALQLIQSRLFSYFPDYMSWANTQAGILRPLISHSDLDRLVTTRRYWLLQTIDPDTHSALGALIEAEVIELIDLFRLETKALATTMEQWELDDLVVAVLDTNVLLHHGED